MGQTAPDQFLPQFRRLMTKQPTVRNDLVVPIRWGIDWRDPSGHWLAIFFSGALLRAGYVAQGIVPDFPLGDPGGTKGSPAAAIHVFAAQLGFGHASRLRQT